MSQFVERSRQGLGSRSKNSIGGALVGLVLVVLGAILLFWNEGRAVDRHRDLEEGAGTVVEVSADSVDPDNEGKLVHISGEAVTEHPLEDPPFGISENALKLIRSAEMYQWVEHVETEEKKNTGGSVDRTKTYTYSREWREQPIDSSEFKVPEGHGNPVEMEYSSTTLLADDVSVGAFRLPEFLVARIGGAEPLEIRSLESASEAVAAAGTLINGDVYFGSDPASPAVGDIRVGYSVVRPGPVSVVARQQGDSLVSYVAKTGGKVDLLERGTLSAEEMFRSARDRNKAMTWAIRVGGFFILAIGFSMILRPLVVFADILPFLGRIVGAGTTAISFLLAAIAWTVVVSLAWIFHRPILGLVILAVTAGLIALIFRKLRKAAPVVPVATPPNDPPPPDAPPPFA